MNDRDLTLAREWLLFSHQSPLVQGVGNDASITSLAELLAAVRKAGRKEPDALLRRIMRAIEKHQLVAARLEGIDEYAILIEIREVLAGVGGGTDPGKD